MDVKQVLEDKSLYYKESGRDYVIRCLNPEHEDNNPSMRVDKVSGLYHCFSCGFKGSIFKRFDIEYDPIKADAIAILEQITDIIQEQEGLQIPPGSIPFDKEYRDIKTSTFQKFRAFKNEEYFGNSVVFPIISPTGDITNFVSRKLYPGEPKYLITPAKKKIDPYIGLVNPIKGSVILVEGMFDMLNLYDKGLENVIACFGTDQITEKSYKEKLTPLILRGISRVFILFDGDDPGQKAAKKLHKLIRDSNLELDSEVIKLPKELDPGDLKQSEVNELYMSIYK